MSAHPLSRALGAVAISLCLASSARAGDPAPGDRHPGRDSTLPTLDQTFGVDATSSQPTTGLAGVSPQKLDDYVKSVQAVNVAFAFHTDKNHTTNVGDTSHWNVHHLGPIPIPVPRLNPGVQIQGNQDIRLSASYSKKNGDSVATLDDIKLQAPAAHFGPFGLLSVQNAEIKSNGEIDLKLARWLPTLRVTQITHDGNGDVHLHVKWAPDVYITKNGDVQIHIGPSWCHYTQTIGHVGVNIFAEWPPSLKDFLGLAAAPAASRTNGMVGALDPNTKKIVDSLAGTATFDLHATTKDTPVDYKGTTASASAQLDIHGEGRVADGTFTTIGDKNTANLKLSIGSADVNTSKGGAKIDHADLTLGGHYQLTLPLDDKTKKMTVDFNGQAAVSAAGKDANLTLPNGATIRVGSFDGSTNLGVKLHSGADGRSFSLDNGQYSLGVSGPIHVEKLGGISSLDADGQLRSQGTIKIGPNGLAQLTGDLHGKGQLASDLPLDVKGTHTTLLKGSNVSVDLAQLDAAMSIPAAAGQAGNPAFVSASASGDLGVHGAVGDTTYTKGGVTVHAPGASVDATFHGGVSAAPGSLTASGHVTGGATLEGPTSVDANTASGSSIHTTLGTGSSVSVDGDVTKNGSGVSASGTVKAHAPVGATSFTKNGLSVSAPSGSLDLTATGKTGSSGTSGHFDASASVGAGTKIEDSAGPYGSHFATTLGAGSELGVAGDLVGNSIKGTVKGQVAANGLDGGVGPATIHIPADATVGVTAPFAATTGGGGVAVQTGHATVPIHVDLHKGTKVTVTYKGVTGSVTLDTEGTFVDLVAQADLVNGKPVVRSLDSVSVNLVLGDVAAAALGQQLGFPVDKRISFNGGAAFHARGLDLHGTVSLGQKGSSASFFHFSW